MLWIIKGKCEDYIMKLLEICPLEKDLEHDTIMSWKCFQEVHVGTTKAGEPKTIISLDWSM
jgi:hypothetical protein